MTIKHKLAKWLVALIQEANSPARSIDSYASDAKTSSNTLVKDNTRIESKCINMRIFPGSGGIAIETSNFDSHSNNYVTTLYIIPDSDDVSERLSQIIVLDAMRAR